LKLPTYKCVVLTLHTLYISVSQRGSTKCQRSAEVTIKLFSTALCLSCLSCHCCWERCWLLNESGLIMVFTDWFRRVSKIAKSDC